MRKRLIIKVDDWLKSAPGGVAFPSKVLPNFAGQPAVYEYIGPHRFVRAAGRDFNGQLARAYGGEWWFDEAVLVQLRARLEQYRGWTQEQKLKAALPTQYRALAAICINWNDMSEFFALDLPAGERLTALAGPAKEQPYDSRMSVGLPTTPMLPGGAEQLFMKVKNPLWISRYDL